VKTFQIKHTKKYRKSISIVQNELDSLKSNNAPIAEINAKQNETQIAVELYACQSINIKILKLVTNT